MRKVLFLIDSLQTGGAEKSLVTIAIKLRSWKPVFIYVYKGNLLEIKLRNHGIEVYSLNVSREYNFEKAVKKIIPIIKAINPDILHSTLFNSDIIARKIKKQVPIPLINSFVNNSYIKDRYKNLSLINKAKLFAFQQYDRFTSTHVDLFISNSEAIKKTNAAALNIPLDKIKVIHRGRETALYENISTHKIDALKIELNIKKNEIILLNVGRLLERKGQMDLLIAFKELQTTNKGLKLLIAGEGFFEPALRTYINSHGLQDNITLLGNRKDIPELLNLADLFVFPSWFEGLPGSLIEAMMAGLPIIASDIPENLECVTSDCALIFKKGDPADLKSKIQWALHHRKEMSKMAEVGEILSKEKFDIEHIVEEYEKTYFNLIK